MTNETKKEMFLRVNRTVCNYFGIAESDIYSLDKTRLFSKARGMIFLYLNVNEKVSASQLANEYSRHLRSVRRSIANMKTFIQIYQEYKKEYDDIVCLLTESCLHLQR